jgi:hypothetical protein
MEENMLLTGIEALLANWGDWWLCCVFTGSGMISTLCKFEGSP